MGFLQVAFLPSRASLHHINNIIVVVCVVMLSREAPNGLSPSSVPALQN